MNIYVSEVYINRTENHGIGDSGVYETRHDTPGALYKAMVKEYGRCTGRVYIDRKDGSTLAIGWVFVKRQKYEDVPETYLQETWVSLHTAPDTVTRESHYFALQGTL